MATLLDAPKAPTAAKLEEYVQRQLTAARRRVRLLDFFSAGLSLAVGALVVLLALQLVDRYVETPRGTGWALLGVGIALAAGYLYVLLFRPSRRDINPYFAASRVEQTLPNAKNSLVTWVDFQEDDRLPGSVRSAIGQKAARDLRGVDLNRAIENKTVLWMAIAAGVILVGNAVVAFLSPTRTELNLEEPKAGDITVFNNQDVTFQVHVYGRIPSPTDADAVRLRLWYNPDDPDLSEDRAMRAAEDDRRQFKVTIPAKQVRTGFRYKILAGNTQTSDYTVTCKIIPEFTGFDVSYVYPDYLKRTPEKTNDQNLLAPFGSVATVIVHTNRVVKNGHIEIEGRAVTLDGQLIEGQPDAIQFAVPMEKESKYRVWFSTPEGDKNADPKEFRLGVIDPKPLIRTFDISYEYLPYLRWKPATAADVKEPEVEAPRGSIVTLTAKANRGVKAGTLEIDGQPPIAGVLVVDQPTWVRFKLLPLDQDATARIIFTPTTAENVSEPKLIPIRAMIDLPPTAKIDTPEPDEITLPTNGTLDVTGLATDDHGVDKLTLRMHVTGAAEDRPLVSKPYRGGMSFLRKEDNSWPTRLEYKDFVKIADLRMVDVPQWRVTPGTKIDYWLEATDNCTFKPGPNSNKMPDKLKRVTIVAAKMDEQKKIDQQNRKRDAEQQKHQQKQDEANKADKRDAQQPPPKGAENEGQKQEGNPMGAGMNPDMPPPMGDPDQNPMSGGMPPDKGDADHDKQTQDVKDAIDKANKEGQAGDKKPGDQAGEADKGEPGSGRPEPKAGPMDPPPAETRQPKDNPNGDDPMKGGPAGEKRGGKLDDTKEDKGEPKDAGKSKAGMPETQSQDKPSLGAGDDARGGKKPDAKPPEPMPGMPPAPKPEKGSAKGSKPQTGSPMNPGDKAPETGETKGDKDVTRSGTKQPPQESESGPAGEKEPADTGAPKPKEAKKPAESRGGPKNEEKADTAKGRNKGPDEAGASGDKPAPPMGGMGDEQANKGGTKPGPSQASEGNDEQKEQGELSREQRGELSREINSTKPKIDDKIQEDVDRLYRDKETREQARKELDKLEKEAKDPLTRKKAQEIKNAGEKAAKNYDEEPPTEEKLNKLAKKLNSIDKNEQKEAQRRLDDWKKDPEKKKELEAKTEELKKKDPAAAKKIDDAINKTDTAKKPEGGAGDKVDPNDLKKAAEQLNSPDEKTREQGRQNLENALKNPETRKQAQDALNQMAKDAKTPEDKKKLEDAAHQAGEIAKDMANKDKADQQKLGDAAKKMANGTPQEKADARKEIEDMMKDPQKRADAEKKLKDMAKNEKDPGDKKALEEAANKAGEIAKEMDQKDKPKPDPKDVADLAKKFDQMSPEEKQAAKKKVEDMMKDEKFRDKMKEMAKNSTPEQKQQMQDMMRQLGGGQYEDAGKPDPADPRNKLKAAELVLDKFKDKKVQTQLGWTEEQMAAWLKKQEETVAALRNQVEKGDWRTNRTGKAANDRGPDAVKLDEKKGGSDPLRGGRSVPPGNYADPYKKLGSGATGVDASVPKK